MEKGQRTVSYCNVNGFVKKRKERMMLMAFLNVVTNVENFNCRLIP